MGTIIREARVEDAPGMAQVIVDTFLESHRGYLPEEAWRKRKAEWTCEISQRSWERALRENGDISTLQECFYVAEDDSGEIVGVATGQVAGTREDPAVGELYVLYVRSSHQGQGVGRGLVRAVAAQLAQWGMTRLQVAALHENAPARRFYESLGGQWVGEREEVEDGFPVRLAVYEWPDIRALAQ